MTRDPFEPVNRSIYRFNESVDRAILRPTARAYRTVVPQFVRTSIGNVFSNLNDVRVVLNNVLQGVMRICSVAGTSSTTEIRRRRKMRLLPLLNCARPDIKRSAR